MPRLFIACRSAETNTISPGPPGFAAYCLRHGTTTADPANLMTESLHLWRSEAKAEDLRRGETRILILRLGGKIAPASGPPVVVTGQIMAIRDKCDQQSGPGLDPMGTAI